MILGAVFGGYFVATATVVIGLLYFPVMERVKTKATVGKLLLGMRVRDTEDGPNWLFWVPFRVILKVLAMAPPLGVFAAVFFGIFAYQEGDVGESALMSAANDGTMFYVLLNILLIILISLSPKKSETEHDRRNLLDSLTKTRLVSAEEV